MRLLLAAVGLMAMLAAVPGAWARSTYGATTSADEPHYLLTAIALAERGTLDVGPELDEQAWRAFSEGGLSRQVEATSGRRVVPHDPLLPALLAGPVGVFGWRAGRLALAVVNGLLAVLLAWTAMRRLDLRPSTAAATTLVATTSAPLVVYGSQVYPELPAALAVVAALAAGLGPPGWRTCAAVVVAVVALPWLSVKYVPVAAVLAILHLVRLWRAGHGRLAGAIVATYAALGAGYVAGHLAWYGGLTVYATGDFFAQHGGQLAVVGTDPDYLGRARRLVGLLLDRGFGLAAWQPAWLLTFPAFAALLRRRPQPWAWWVLAPLAAGWLVATFVAVTMHGWWFPGRHVVHALPLAVLAIAWWLDRAGPRVRAATLAAGLLGVWSTAWVVGAAVQGTRTMIVDFAATADPWYGAWSLLLPDYLNVTAGTWIRHGAWLALLTGAAVLAWRRDGPPTGAAISRRSRRPRLR